MSEAEDIEKVIRALQKVPEKKLRIIELANSIPIRDGFLDVTVLADLIPEINLATAEATAYGTATIRAVDALVRRVPGRAEPDRLEPATEEDILEGMEF